MSQNLRQRQALARRVECDRDVAPSRADPAVLRIHPPAPPPKRVIYEEEPFGWGAWLRIAIWVAVVTAAALVQIG